MIPPPSEVEALDRAAELFPKRAREGRAHASQDDVEPEPGLQAERQPIQEVRQGQSDFLLAPLRTQVEPQARSENAGRPYPHDHQTAHRVERAQDNERGQAGAGRQQSKPLQGDKLLTVPGQRGLAQRGAKLRPIETTPEPCRHRCAVQLSANALHRRHGPPRGAGRAGSRRACLDCGQHRQAGQHCRQALHADPQWLHGLLPTQ